MRDKRTPKDVCGEARPHSVCSLIQPKLFASFRSTSSRKSCTASELELIKPLKNFQVSKALLVVYDICRLQTADCMRQQDCLLNETKNIVIKVASSSTLFCSEK